MMLIANLSRIAINHFGICRQHSQSRENINFPEDEVVRGSEGDIEEIGGPSNLGEKNPLNTLTWYYSQYMSGLLHCFSGVFNSGHVL